MSKRKVMWGDETLDDHFKRYKHTTWQRFQHTFNEQIPDWSWEQIATNYHKWVMSRVSVKVVIEGDAE